MKHAAYAQQDINEVLFICPKKKKSHQSPKLKHAILLIYLFCEFVVYGVNC